MCLSASDTSATRNGKPFATGETIVRLERIVALRGGTMGRAMGGKEVARQRESIGQ